MLLEHDTAARKRLHADLAALAAGEPATLAAADAVRRTLVETLHRGDRAALADELDDLLLGLGARPALRRVS